jgi:hypothetical protein
MKYKVVDECNYSISDLFKKANVEIPTDITQEELNTLIRQLCDKINWYWEDRIGTDGLLYTAFSPHRINY